MPGTNKKISDFTSATPTPTDHLLFEDNATGTNRSTPLSGLIQSGSNANGDFIKFPNGTAIVFGSVAASASGGAKTFALTFASAPRVMISSVGGSSPVAVSYGSVTTSGCTVYSASGTPTVAVWAYGTAA